MVKDAADLFAEKGEGAKGSLERLKQEAQDALDSELAEAPEGSKRERYRYAKEGLFPLISRLGTLASAPPPSTTSRRR